MAAEDPGTCRADAGSCHGGKGYRETDSGKGMGVLLLKRINRILPVYAADISGVCSALYELGGMTVMHDASGCNSTYTTHDEPRWYSMDSMVYISALSELEAVMGDDDKLVRDIVDAARNLHPRFICLGGTPIPMMMGTDFKGLARMIEKETGIPTFGIATNGMHSYVRGGRGAAPDCGTVLSHGG